MMKNAPAGVIAAAGAARARLSSRPRALGLCSIVLTFLLLLQGGLPTSAAAPEENTPKRTPAVRSDAETVIAQYLCNFLRYVDWPAAVPPVKEPWRIGLLRAADLQAPLKLYAEGKAVKDRPILIVVSSDPAVLRDCQIVVLGYPMPANAGAVLEALKDLPVLTVVYQERGTMVEKAAIELVRQGRSIRYRLNASQLTARGLKPTPGLLENSLPPITPPLALAHKP